MQNMRGIELLGDDGKTILTREYEFTRENGSEIVIQDHSVVHKFGAPEGRGDQGPHFNLRPIGNTRTGKIAGTRDHYYFKVNK